ncbi:unnamed protein product [Eretmochelys imbricata]
MLNAQGIRSVPGGTTGPSMKRDPEEIWPGLSVQNESDPCLLLVQIRTLCGFTGAPFLPKDGNTRCMLPGDMLLPLGVSCWIEQDHAAEQLRKKRTCEDEGTRMGFGWDPGIRSRLLYPANRFVHESHKTPTCRRCVTGSLVLEWASLCICPSFPGIPKVAFIVVFYHHYRG